MDTKYCDLHSDTIQDIQMSLLHVLDEEMKSELSETRVLTNSKFGLFYSNFLNLTPTFSKVPIEKYGKTPNFSGKQHFYSYFQNPGENSGETKYYGLIIDESTDLSIHKKLVVYIRYVCPIEICVKTKLVGNIRIPDGTASTIVTEVINKLRTIGLQTVNLLGLGSDGASVMFGRKTGVGVQLLKESCACSLCCAQTFPCMC